MKLKLNFLTICYILCVFIWLGNFINHITGTDIGSFNYGASLLITTLFFIGQVIDNIEL